MIKIHFLNVGHGDCTIIEHQSGNITVVDICNGGELREEDAAEIAEELGISPVGMINAVDETKMTPYEILRASGYGRELENPIKFYEARYKKKPIFRYIQTHPDMDHMRGLVALQTQNIPIINFWDTRHNKTISDFFAGDEEEWKRYLEYREGKTNAKLLHLNRGDVGNYYNSHEHPDLEGDGLHILAPTPETTNQANKDANWNNHSYVLWLKYKDVCVILGGDAEAEVWGSIVEKYGKNISCHVLKASHHGRDSGYHDDALALMSPLYTIVSVGKKPDTDASNKYKKHSKNVWSTRWKGNITCTITDEGKFYMESQYDN